MKTLELTTPYETRTAIHELLTAGYVLHGSPIRNLATLRAVETGFQHIDRRGCDVPNEKLLCTTEDPDYAIFFAAAHAPVRDERIAKNIPRTLLSSSVTGKFDDDGQFLRFEYWASPGTKEFIKARETAGIFGAVYYCCKDGLVYREEDREWVSTEDVQAVGSLTVSVACLSFDYYQLPDPASNPMLREYNERADALLGTSSV